MVDHRWGVKGEGRRRHNSKRQRCRNSKRHTIAPNPNAVVDAYGMPKNGMRGEQRYNGRRERERERERREMPRFNRQRIRPSPTLLIGWCPQH